MSHPLLRDHSRFISAFERQEPTCGCFLLSGSAGIAECLSMLDFDWLVVDMEASPVSYEGVTGILQAMSGTPVAPLVRVRELNQHAIEHVLDLGAAGIMAPKVDTPEMARALVNAAYYPPLGNRGVNPVRASGYFSDVKGYLERANHSVSVIAQIESVSALEHVEQIAAVAGIGCLFIGCGDLAMSLGQPGEVTGPAMDSARRKVLAACLGAGKVPGIFAYSLDLARQYAQEGFRFIAIGNDYKFLREGAEQNLAAVHGRG